MNLFYNFAKTEVLLLIEKDVHVVVCAFCGINLNITCSHGADIIFCLHYFVKNTIQYRPVKISSILGHLS